MWEDMKQLLINEFGGGISLEVKKDAFMNIAFKPKETLAEFADRFYMEGQQLIMSRQLTAHEAYTACAQALKVNQLLYTACAQALKVNQLLYTACAQALKVNQLLYTACAQALKVNQLLYTACAQALKVNQLLCLHFKAHKAMLSSMKSIKMLLQDMHLTHSGAVVREVQATSNSGSSIRGPCILTMNLQNPP
ncbi:hypothetical protein DSO57_1032972 [Entomophthora muscae]|uniref:Uncharacterized protein n=1 Tax=Entomophthora muscae TaxID=34485 RepID=A0ACC2S256_9FUNG|nr:hypothetical protein DSO57_1032972 [Entomophthora muscae]